MDCHPVTSRALYDEADSEIQVVDQPSQPQTCREEKPEQDLVRVETDASAAEAYPEGGLKAWSVVLGAWFALFASLGLLNTVSVFQAYVLSHQLKAYNEGTVGWIFSIYTFLAFFCGVYIGPVFDKYGPRWLILAGTIVTTGGLVGMSFCTELWQFILSFGLVCGIGSSLLFTPSIASVGHWFLARRGFAMGTAYTAGGIGGIILPLMQTALFDRIGFGWTTRVVGLICLFCGLVGLVLLRSRLPPARNATVHPDIRIFRYRPFLLVSLGLLFLELALFVPVAYLSTYAIRQGYDETFAFHLVPILNAGSALGRILPAYYTDVVGPFNTSMASIVLSIVSLLGVWLPAGSTKPGIIIFSVLFGFASGTSIAVSSVCVGRLCRTREYGRYHATAYTVISFSTLINIPIAGNIVKAAGGEYYGLIAFTSVSYTLALGFIMMAKVNVKGWSQWKSVF